MLEKVSRQHPQPNNVNQFTSVSDPEQPGPSAFGRTVGACAGKTFLGLIWTKSSRKQESVHLALKQRDSRNKRLPSLGSSFAQRKRSLISTPSTKTGVVTMEAMPQQIPPYLLLYLCAIANQTAAVQTCFLRGGFAGGCSRPHVLPFHSPSVGLTLPFNEGPHFPCFRSREMESPCRCCDGMGAWGDRPLPTRCHLASLPPALAPSSSNSLPGQQQRQRRFQCARQNKREYGGRLPTTMYYVYAEGLDRTRERSSPRYSVLHRCRRSNPTPAPRTNPLWILLGLAFPLARTPKQLTHGPGRPSQNPKAQPPRDWAIDRPLPCRNSA